MTLLRSLVAAALALAPQFGVLVVAVLVLPVALLAARALPIDPATAPAARRSASSCRRTCARRTWRCRRSA